LHRINEHREPEAMPRDMPGTGAQNAVRELEITYQKKAGGLATRRLSGS
jgi:hypothetical protein